MEVLRSYEASATGEAPSEVLVSFLEREMPWGLEWEILAERGYEGVSLRKSLAQPRASFEDRQAIRQSLKADIQLVLHRLGWLPTAQEKRDG